MTPDFRRATYKAAPRKEYSVPNALADAFMVEVAQWDRIKARVEHLERQPSLGWLTSGAWTAVGIAASALLTVLVLPSSGDTQLGSGVKPALWIISIACTLLGAALFVLAAWARKERSN